MIDSIGQRAPTSLCLLGSVLTQEEKHCEDLVALPEHLPKD
jgi:hypothetical protein